MGNYQVKIELLSETILGSGESVAGYIDLEVLHDELGLPFLKGKTLKGRLREEAENIARLQSEVFSEDQVNKIFGVTDSEEDTILALSDCTVSDNIKKALKYSGLDSKDVLNSLTDIRSFTAIDDEGIAQDGSLRQIRVINKGLKLTAKASFRNEISKDDLTLFGLSVLSLKHIGLMCSRGKGKVKCTLIKDNEDITNMIIDNLREKVK